MSVHEFGKRLKENAPVRGADKSVRYAELALGVLLSKQVRMGTQHIKRQEKRL